MGIVAIRLAVCLAACIGDRRIKITYIMLRSHKCVDHFPIRLHGRLPPIAFIARALSPQSGLYSIYSERASHSWRLLLVVA